MNAPDSWASSTIEECCDILDNKRVPVNAEERQKRIGDVPYYGANGQKGFIDDYIFDEPLILIAEDGGRFDEFATRPIAYRIDGKSWVNNHAHVLRAKSGFNQDAVFYTLEHKDIQPFIVGGTRAKLNQGSLRSITIQLPQGLPEQAKIAEVLSTVDRAIDETAAVIAKQQRIKTGLMQDLLTCGIDEHGKLRTEETHAFKDSPVGRVPKAWVCPSIGDLANHVKSGVTPRGGQSVYTPDGVLFLRSQNVHFGELRLDDVAYIPERIHRGMLRSQVFENDVLLNITGASIGRCCRMPTTAHEANVNQHVCAIRLKEVSRPRAGFISAVLESHIGQRQIAQLNAGGNREGLNYQQVRAFVVPWPSDPDEFTRVTDAINSVVATIDAFSEAVHKLRLLRAGLMQDLLSGDRRVTALLDKREAVTA